MAGRKETQKMLNLTCAMWDDEKVLCYQDAEGSTWNQDSIFLAGPSSREDVLEFKWRSLAVHYLREAGFIGIIFIPEPRENDWAFKENFPEPIVAWEARYILQSDLVLFWIPRHQTQLPGRVTNTELGFMAGRACANPERFKYSFVWGHPRDAWKVKSEHHWVSEIAGIEPLHDLNELCIEAVRLLGDK